MTGSFHGVVHANQIRILILAAMVGAIALARAVDDPGFSDEILERVARVLRRHVQGECAPSAAPERGSERAVGGDIGG